MIRTTMARLSRLIRTRFRVPIKFFRQLKEKKTLWDILEIFLFYHENLCYIYSLESPR